MKLADLALMLLVHLMDISDKIDCGIDSCRVVWSGSGVKPDGGWRSDNFSLAKAALIINPNGNWIADRSLLHSGDFMQ